ncbi:MAG TPA: EAL domain-containing protein [Streptosporangiaceae bacterium]|nr:EAL domain-containing protein [Streptosporangiaceae bacterium]
MRTRNDPRDVRPRVGSPLWVHMAAVIVTGAAVLAAAGSHIGSPPFLHLLASPLLWIIAALAFLGEVWPFVTPGKTDRDSGHAAHIFCFAALLYWGLPLAVLMRVGIALVEAVFRRPAPFRAAFNTAQYTLSLGAAGLVLAMAGIFPGPAHPWVPQGGQWLAAALAALAYFSVNFVLVGVAVALHSRTSVVAMLVRELPYQGFVNIVLLSAAPLVVVVMDRSALLVLLFVLPLVAIHANAAVSLQREYQAHHDELTGLPNRTFLLRKSTQALADAARTAERAGFLLLDLDRFKEVNDTLGHCVGDNLLKVVATRLAHSVRPGDMVARLGGDEFAVLLPCVPDRSVAMEVAARLRACLVQPIELEGMSFEVEASVGIALYPDDACDVERLMQRADVAMYLAKERGTGVEAYVSEADRNSAARLSLLADLRCALDEGELELHFQPKVSLLDGHTTGMEALLRWRHPERGVVLPAEFIPAAEQSYLMRGLTAWVVDSSLGWAAQWRRAGLSVQVCVNLTARDLLDVGLADMIQAALRRHGLAPADLMLEVSERVLAGGPAHAGLTVDSLAALGVPISLDDFGTGHSSLVKLKRLPISEVKIDASLVSKLRDCPDDRRIVASLVDLVRALGIRSVAEGVETTAVASALRTMGCDSAQGWHFSAPLEPAAATVWLAAHSSVPQPATLLPLDMPRKARQPASQPGKAPVPPAGAAAGSPGHSG